MTGELGGKIADLRKQKGMTQEQLAGKLGISAPAVSKWETNTSYPDITLLCPLARALGTNVDTLLQFEENLSDREVTDRINEIAELSRKEGYEAGEARILALLHQYPGCVALKFNAALMSDVFRMFFPSVGGEVCEGWKKRKKELLTEVRASGDGAYWQPATLQLAGIALEENNTELAERLLKELPEHSIDTSITWARLYSMKKEPEEALKATQRRLFSLVRQVQTCLSVMMNPEILPEEERQLEVCQVYRGVEELFHCGGGMGDGLFLEVYLRLGKLSEAADCLERYVEALTGEAVMPKASLFSPGLPMKKGEPASMKELRRMLVEALEKEERYREFLEIPKCRAAVEKLRESL